MGIVESQSKSYKSYIETSVRCFIKASLSSDLDKRYGIPVGLFKDYQSIIDFIYAHEPAQEVKLSRSSISKLKLRNSISRTVPRTPENEAFIEYVEQNIKTFNSALFFKENDYKKDKVDKKE
jgi:hypothetical protein